jgi:hypothetical protein
MVSSLNIIIGTGSKSRQILFVACPIQIHQNYLVKSSSSVKLVVEAKLELLESTVSVHCLWHLYTSEQAEKT